MPDEEDYLREIPEGSGAVACFGFSWSDVVAALGEDMRKMAPDIREKKTIWSVRSRPNGIRILLFDNEDDYFRFMQQEEQQKSLMHGPQVHAGRVERA